MASTRPSSPSTLLSPTSKLRAPLATVGSDSEDGSTTKSTTQNGGPSRSLSPDDESDEDNFRPRGAFASRMFESLDDRSPGSGTGDGVPGETARDRVRRLLKLDGPGEPENTNTTQKETTEDPNEQTGDESNDNIPVAPRRRKRPAARESTPQVTSPLPASSPGLFVSPGQQSVASKDNNIFSDSDGEGDSLGRLSKSSRFQALVDRKRQEREAREAKEAAEKASRRAMQPDEEEEHPRSTLQLFSDSDGGNTSSITDDDAGRKMSQRGRPSARKASKKALEEMNRETQRMARSMQLAHQAKTKKKITKAALFERFNFRPAGGAKVEDDAGKKETVESSSRPTSPLSAYTDVEMKDGETPPSSPPAALRKEEQSNDVIVEVGGEAEEEDLPSIDHKGKAVATEADMLEEEQTAKEAESKRRVRIKLPSPAANTINLDSDSDDLTITKPKNARLNAIFNRVPKNKANGNRGIQAFRLLAQPISPGKPARGAKGKDKPGMTRGELDDMLLRRAREQARAETERRIEMLRAKGVVVQTQEDKERELAEVEDIVSRARKEAEEIMQRERAAAKKDRKERIKNGEADSLGWDDSSDDGDYEGSAEEDSDDDDADGEDVPEIELSGSESEGEPDDGVEEEETGPNPLFENEAADDESEASNVENGSGAEDIDMEDDDVAMPKARRARKVQIVSDDDEEVEPANKGLEATPKPKPAFFKSPAVKATPRPKPAFFQSPAPPNTKSPAAPTSVLRSATKTFIPGLPIAPCNPAGLGLTQMFAGTMADSQMVSPPTQSMSDSPMPTFDPFARPAFPDSQDMNDDDDVVMDSQVPATQQDTQGGMDLHHSQTQMHNLDSLLREDATQLSQYITFTQDTGPEEHTPLKERFVDMPSSTMATIPADDPTQEAVQESPLVRRGRLRRKLDAIPESASEAEEESEREASPEKDEFGFGTTSAFSAMKKAAMREGRRKRKEEFDRKKSEAKGMVEEQAEESEDEYAALGGGDEDDDSNDDLGSVKDLIDEKAENMTAEEERKLAAFYADRARADDEKNVERLFKDITTGMLRRKRANDYDLSDSDDGGEARKRLKRRQFAKMQKALFSDERVKKIAENPGNQAFLRTLEDRASDDEMDFIDVVEERRSGESSSFTEESQGGEAGGDVLVPNSQVVGQQQQQQQPSVGGNGGERPPAHMRRTKNGRKPSNIGEVRETLSSLLEEPEGSVIPATQLGLDSESDEDRDEDGRPSGSNKENVSPPRANANANNRRGGVVRDRISLRGMSTSESASGNARRAFTMGSTQPGFKGATLLRRATSNSLLSNMTSGSSAPTTGGGGSRSLSSSSSGSSKSGAAASNCGMFADKIKKGAGRGSGVSFGGGRKPVSAAEGLAKKRTERKMRGTGERLKAASGLLSSGKFE